MAGGGTRIKQYQLTLNGSAQQLSSAFASDQTLVGADEGNPVCAFIDLQADDGNSNAIYVGGDETVTAASHGVRIPAPATGVPSPPYRITGLVTPSSVWVIGTNNEKLNVFAEIG